MFKKLPKIIKLFFLIIFLLQIAGLIFLLIMPETTQAAKAVFSPQVPLNGVTTGSTIGNYIEAIYKYAIGIVGILATVVMMWGGVIWITAGGNTERISNAKSWISASLTGLVLALASYTILYTVNPSLVKFEPIVVDEISELGSQKNCCSSIKGPFGGFKTENSDGSTQFSCSPSDSWLANDYGSIWTCTEEQKCILVSVSSFACKNNPNIGSDCISDNQCYCFNGDTPRCLFNGDEPPKKVCFCT